MITATFLLRQRRKTAASPAEISGRSAAPAPARGIPAGKMQRPPPAFGRTGGLFAAFSKHGCFQNWNLAPRQTSVGADSISARPAATQTPRADMESAPTANGERPVQMGGALGSFMRACPGWSNSPPGASGYRSRGRRRQVRRPPHRQLRGRALR